MTDNPDRQQLCAAVYADGTLVLEQQESRDSATRDLSGSTETVEERVFRLYNDPASRPLFWLLVLGCAAPGLSLSPELEFFRGFSELFLRKARLTGGSARGSGFNKCPTAADIREILYCIPPFPGAERVNTLWLEQLRKELATTLAAELAAYKGTIDEYLSMLSPTGSHADRVHFHLVENPLDSERPFAFLASYSGLNEDGKIVHRPLSGAVKELGSEHDKMIGLLAAVQRVAQRSSLIRELLDSGELFQTLAFSIEEAHTFLSEVGQYEAAGILCKIPRWWKSSRSAIKIGVKIGQDQSELSAQSLMSIDSRLMIDDLELSMEDIRQILEETAPLAMIKGKWIAVDHEGLRAIQDYFEQARTLVENNSISFKEALKMIMKQKVNGLASDVPIEVSAGDWMASVLKKLGNPASINKRKLPKDLRATLRPYQKLGFQWLSFLTDLGFGGCLADDMGLGKTLQIVALLLDRRQNNDRAPHLVIAPTSLLENWKQELARFAPKLSLAILHSSELSAAQAREALKTADVLLTTYGMLQKSKWLFEMEFDCIVLDEAQAIKNPSTSQSRAVRKLQGQVRLLMTGTPIENSLTDIWSLFDFVNPGLLGTSQEFKAYVKKAADSPYGYGRLRQTIAPYILRRMKTDKSIIADLPEKTETKVYAELSKTQAVLYHNLVAKLEQALAHCKTTEKMGIVLGYIQKFKQLCNHPDQLTGSGSWDIKDSGKFSRLVELCDKIRQDREKVLIFSQFTEIIPPLEALLEKVFGAPGVCLTGSMSVAQRKKAVEHFQSDPKTQFFLLSVRAGGVGLNLTAASQVIHFDRWWNPAVENQATDRAFRIGQNRRVLVHKFITRATMEENIDRMIEKKMALAEDITANAESILAKMSSEEIVKMFSASL